MFVVMGQFATPIPANRVWVSLYELMPDALGIVLAPGSHFEEEHKHGKAAGLQ
jgi:hypothetical protein